MREIEKEKREEEQKAAAEAAAAAAAEAVTATATAAAAASAAAAGTPRRDIHSKNHIRPAVITVERGTRSNKSYGRAVEDIAGH